MGRLVGSGGRGEALIQLAIESLPGPVERKVFTAPQDRTVLGRELCELRELRGMSVVDLASAIGVTPAYLRRVEAGKASPSLRLVWNVAYELGGKLVLTINDREVRM